jgi:predicted MPP superfamily phosphohydrolase
MHRYLIEAFLYAGLHLYCLLRVRAAFACDGLLFWALTAAFVLLAAQPVVCFAADRDGVYWIARPAAIIGYTWMAVIICFGVLVAAVDLWNAGAQGLSRMAPGWARLALPIRWAFGVSGAAVLAGAIWGWVEAGRIGLETMHLETSRLAPGSPPLRILQLTDLHLGLVVRRRALARVLRIVDEVKPDLIVSTGDTVDASFRHLDEEAAMLAACRPPLGKYAVLGNHEYIARAQASLEFLNAAGFTVLRAESDLVDGRLLLAGVDDPAGRIWRQEARLDEDAALPREPDRPLTVLLKHRPTVSEDSVGRFDLQLSGHTHGGQIWPCRLVLLVTHRYRLGLHALGKGSTLYVSRGAGTWGPPVRVFVPPEVTLFAIHPRADPGGASQSTP